MTHRAESIVSAVKTLVTGLSTTGSRVDRGRDDEIDASLTPALRVAMGEDKIVDGWTAQLVDSDLDVHIFGFAHDVAQNIETLLAKIREEVTIALTANYTLGLAYVQAIVEQGAERPTITGDMAKPAGRIEMIFRVRYRRSRTDPGN